MTSSLSIVPTYVEPALPTLETIAKLRPIADPEGRSIPDVLDELNAAIKAVGIEFGENEFSWGRYGVQEKFENYRWIDCTAVPGSNEGYYIHITLIPRQHDKEPSRLIATAKTWSWPSALAIAAPATRLLQCW
jgi:hypothetical protein